MGLEERSGDALPLPLGTKVPLKHCCAEPAVQTSSQWKDQAPSAVPRSPGWLRWERVGGTEPTAGSRCSGCWVRSSHPHSHPRPRPDPHP